MTKALNYLLDAVDKLSQPRTTAAIQANDAGITCTSSVEHEPLLAQLRAAIVGGIGSHAGSSPGNERIPFDAGALELYDRIEAEISEWFTIRLEQPVYLTPEQTLRQWYIAYHSDRTAGNVTDEAYQEKVRTLEGWARSIVAKFDPPRTLELTIALREPDTTVVRKYGEVVKDDAGNPVRKVKLDPITKKPLTRIARHLPAACPECEATIAHNPKTGDQTFALILEYHDDALDTVADAAAICRSCEATWVGGVRVRALALHIEGQETLLNTPKEALDMALI
ncbi:DUF7341 domain-containing protein [Cryobacterium cryoconiti]|uniref:DUF7341 domain-containing protein n=1 Tax=Cryobacterium cryoconiti TaxID=1259239 RepID=A0A4Y8JSL5_9MICO|nr:hypothetical protein [Cryobacterium cryoconiti]TFD27506.1 hypothetical protein E3T49_13270 [Cryobacterium cryoconiti]